MELEPNAKLNRGTKNITYYYALDAGWNNLELYRKNPFIKGSKELPEIVIENHEAVIWYKSNKPKPKKYKLTMIEDAFFEQINKKDKPCPDFKKGEYEIKSWEIRKTND